MCNANADCSFCFVHISWGCCCFDRKSDFEGGGFLSMGHWGFCSMEYGLLLLFRSMVTAAYARNRLVVCSLDGVSYANTRVW